MTYTTYAKWIGIDVDGISLDDLMQALADFVLQSGFQGQSRSRGDTDTVDALREAPWRPLMRAGFPSEDVLEALKGDDGEISDAVMQDLIDRLIERLVAEGYLSLEDVERLAEGQAAQQGEGRVEPPSNEPVHFRVTQKGTD